MAVTWHSNGLGEPLCTDWHAMDEPIGEAMGEAGPNGSIEFDVVDGEQRWRVWRPFNWDLGG